MEFDKWKVAVRERLLSVDGITLPETERNDADLRKAYDDLRRVYGEASVSAGAFIVLVNRKIESPELQFTY